MQNQDDNLNWIANEFLKDLKQKQNTDSADFEKCLSISKAQNYKSKLLEYQLSKAGCLILCNYKSEEQLFYDISQLIYCNPSRASTILPSLTHYFKFKLEKAESVSNNVFKLLQSLIANFETSSNENSTINQLVFLKLVFKNCNRFKISSMEEDWIQFLQYSIEYLDSLAINKVLFKSSRLSRFTNIYLLNKYMKCVTLLWLDVKGLFDISTDLLNKKDQFLNNCLENLLDEFGEIELLNDKTLIFRVLFMVLKILASISNDLTTSQAYSTRLHSIFYLRASEFKLEQAFKSDQEQDDDLIIDFNYFCLNYELNKNKKKFLLMDELVDLNLNGHYLFFNLLHYFISFDYEIIIDWLISNETNCLVYFLSYLKYLFNDLEKNKLENLNKKINYFNQQNEKNCISLLDFVKFLNKIYFKIKKMKKSFPYNCDPLVKILEKVLSVVGFLEN